MNWKPTQKQCPKCDHWSEVYMNLGICPFCEKKDKGPTVLDVMIAVGLVVVLIAVWRMR